jgi:UDP-N-acetylmuramate--alanine ligase
MLSKIKKIHFVGIGGIGMSGIAEILHRQGYIVSGSDKNLSDVTDRLNKLGIKIFEGHSADNIDNCDLLVYTSAVGLDNLEVRTAVEKNILTVKRAEMLAECMRKQYGICIAGTHGKTTTTSMIGLILKDAGLKPTILVGGNLTALGGSNASLGKGEYIVVEADEFDRTFLKLTPSVAVLTNLELEHLDTYKDLEDIKYAFTQFANKVPFYGFIVLCADEKNLNEILPSLNREVITYGISNDAQVRAEKISHSKFYSSFKVIYYGKSLGELKLKIPGLHNVKNALAAVSVAIKLGIKFSVIKKSLRNFSGAQRRFEIKYDKKIMLIDDYAHHPTEIAATLAGIKDGWNRRLIAVFQPHLYSRTKDFYEDFGKSFLKSDIFICTDVYPAREKPIEGVTGELIANAAKNSGHKKVYYVKDKNKLPETLMSLKADNDIIITMGAGDIWKYGENFLELLKKNIFKK